MKLTKEERASLSRMIQYWDQALEVHKAKSARTESIGTKHDVAVIVIDNDLKVLRNLLRRTAKI